MDKTLVGILIGSCATLLGVALTSLFNYLIKRKELKHNEYLKEIELRDREKERKFKVEEKMIEKSIEAHKNCWSLSIRLLGLMIKYLEVDPLKWITDGARDEFYRLLVEVRDFNLSQGFFLEKRIREHIDGVTMILIHKLTPGEEPFLTGMEIREEMFRAAKWLQAALEVILKEYNPLYDLGIKLPEI